ncbi:hypothetical protein GCM10023195_64330 [Actinoallomurus liliacearum]|uniref:Uncharacterized protein n=1 Tax=Actinoallomurus liliacearum TaxID=1080073 RepID=A0ABP8TRV2_9ACTN
MPQAVNRRTRGAARSAGGGPSGSGGTEYGGGGGGGAAYTRRSVEIGNDLVRPPDEKRPDLAEPVEFAAAARYPRRDGVGGEESCEAVTGPRGRKFGSGLRR